MPDDSHYAGSSGGDFFPPPSKPRKVTGGIRASTRRGQFGQTWWSRRWLAALESLGIGARLDRGRDYARQGQVISLNIELGSITATVQGTRSTPYDAKIEVATLGQQEWLQLAGVLAEQAIYRAKLLAGEMPEDVEAVFARAGYSLFPLASDDLRVSCTCPDWADPCKHVAAACYLVGEEFDRDPFLIFRMRGIERDVLLALLAAQAARAAGDDSWAPEEAAQPTGIASPVLPSDPAAFWGPVGGSEEAAHGVQLDLRQPPGDAPLVRILGPLPLWRGADDFEPTMQRLYRRAAAGPAAGIALGDVPPTT